MIDNHISQNNRMREEEQFNKIRDLKEAIIIGVNKIKNL